MDGLLLDGCCEITCSLFDDSESLLLFRLGLFLRCFLILPLEFSPLSLCFLLWRFLVDLLDGRHLFHHNLDGGGEDGGSAVGDCVVLIRLVLGEIVIARCEASPSTVFPLPPIRKGLRAFFGVMTDWVVCEEGTNSLVGRISDSCSASILPGNG